VTWLMHMCDMTHAYLWRDLSICVTWHSLTCVTCLIDISEHDAFTHGWHDAVTWLVLVYMCDTPRAYTAGDCEWYGDSSRQYPFMCDTWPIHVGHMTHTYEWHDECIFVTWRVLVNMRDMMSTWLVRTQGGISSGRAHGLTRPPCGKYTNTHMHICMALLQKRPIYTDMYNAQTHIQICIRSPCGKYTNTHTNMYIHTCVHIHIYIYLCTRVHIDMYIYMYVYACLCIDTSPMW